MAGFSPHEHTRNRSPHRALKRFLSRSLLGTRILSWEFSLDEFNLQGCRVRHDGAIKIYRGDDEIQRREHGVCLMTSCLHLNSPLIFITKTMVIFFSGAEELLCDKDSSLKFFH